MCPACGRGGIWRTDRQSGCMLYLLDKFFLSIVLQVVNTSMAGGNSDNSTEKKWVGTD